MLKFNKIAPKQISRILLWHILGFIWMNTFTLRHSKVTFSDGSFWLLSHESRGLVRNLISRFLKQMPSIIRQKGKSLNGCFKKIKHAKFSEKRSFLTPLTRRHTFFLKHPIWDSRFGLITNHTRNLREISQQSSRDWCEKFRKVPKVSTNRRGRGRLNEALTCERNLLTCSDN